MAGCTVVEFELMATAAPPSLEERAEALEQVDGAEVVDRGQQRTGPVGRARRDRHRSRCRPARHRTARRPRRRPGGGRRAVARSATMSESSLSIPMTCQPAAPSRAAVAAPMPDAAPVMTTVRSGSGARLEEGERLVGVRAHGDLAVDDVEQGAVGVDDEGRPACSAGSSRRAWRPAVPRRRGRDRTARGSRATPSRRTASASRRASALMPTGWAPTAANSPARSRKWQLSFVQPYVMAAG